MNIYIEVYSITHPYVGIGEFCLNLGKQLAQRATELKEKYDINLTFIVPKGYEGTFGNDVNYVSFLGDVKFLSRLHGSCIDLLHLPHQYCRFKHFPNVKNTLMTIHDINFMYEKQGRKLEKYKKKFAKKLHLSNYICYISQFTKKDTESNFDVECVTRVIYNGVSKVPAESVTVTEEFKKKLPNKPYLFHISSLRPKKNVHLLIEMMAFLPDEHLVIAGDWSGKYGEDMQERIKELGLQNITCLNNVSVDEKIWLYNNSKAFLFPSVCEGFGLPPIEAMYYGKPAFLSELTSLPEVGGEHAFYWHDLEPKKMATVVEDKLKDVESHPDMVSQIKHSTDRFDWAKCAEEYINYYLDILNIRHEEPAKDVSKEPLVSIITVCWNAADTLAQTIENAEAQTYKKKEIIVVDGASTDCSVDIIKQHSDCINKWVSEPDKGIYDAMNKGVRMAKGEWVIFMNSGDTFTDSNVLERIFIEPQTADIIYGDVVKQRNDGSYYIHAAEQVHNSHRMFFCHQSSLVRRTLLLETPFDTKHRYSADFKFFKLMLLSGHKFCKMPFPISNFDTNGISNTQRFKGLCDNLLVIKEVDGFWTRLRLLPRLYFQLIMSWIRSKIRRKTVAK